MVENIRIMDPLVNLNSEETKKGGALLEDGTKNEIKLPRKVDQAQVPEYLKAIGMDPRKFWPKKYRFTREPIPGQANPLETSQRNFYEANGYIVLDDTVSPKLLQAICAQYHDNWHGGADQTMTPTDLIESKLYKKFVTSSNLMSYAGCFTDEQILLMTSSLVNSFKANQPASQAYHLQQRMKTSDSNATTRRDDKDKIVNTYEDLWHSGHSNDNNNNNKDQDQGSPPTLLAASATNQAQQPEAPQTGNWAKKASATFENAGYQFLYRDWMYLPFRPIDKIVCTVTALEPIHQVLLVVPGTHRVGQCTISRTCNEDNKMSEVFESAPSDMKSMVESAEKQSKYINLKPGQTLFYNPGLIHGYSNDLVNSKQHYLAVITYYASGDCKYIDYEPSKDLIDHKSLAIPVGLAHFGHDNPADYKSWIGRVRMVRDKPINL